MKKWLTILCIIIAVVLSRCILRPFLEQLEFISYDLRAKISTDLGPFSGDFKPVDRNIVVLTVDDDSRKILTQYRGANPGVWPWRRNVWGQVVNFLEKDKPKAILFDMIFTDVDDNYSYDWEFSNTLKKYDNVVLATTLTKPKRYIDHATKKGQDYEVVNSDYVPTGHPLNVEMQDKKMDENITYLSHGAIADRYSKPNVMAVVSKVNAQTSAIRATQPIFKLVKDGKTYYMPSLAFAGFMKAVGEDGKIVVKKHKIIYKGYEIPVSEFGTTLISWHGVGHTYTFVPISSVLLQMNGIAEHPLMKLKPGFFKNKIVIIGRTESGTDIHASAVDDYYPGPEVNATAIDNFINDSNKNNPTARKIVTEISALQECLLTSIFCLLIVWVGIASRSAFLGLLNSFLLMIFYLLLAVYAFANPDVRLWIPIVAPLYYVIVAAAVVYSYRLHHETTKKAEVMNMFGKFVSPGVLSQLLKTSDGLVMKNSKKTITIMFCDVKDFTSLSEKCNPEQLVSNLNELFNEIVNIVFENNGTVDKFVGDCIMAYWGDPLASEDDPYMAVKTALDIKKKVDELKIINAREGKIVFDVKIGINTGDALLGLAGSEKIMSYTAMGDAVNVASRLESSCSKLNKDVLIAKSTYEGAKNKIVALEVGSISVKGKDERITVYEPIGLVDESAQDVTSETQND